MAIELIANGEYEKIERNNKKYKPLVKKLIAADAVSEKLIEHDLEDIMPKEQNEYLAILKLCGKPVAYLRHSCYDSLDELETAMPDLLDIDKEEQERFKDIPSIVLSEKSPMEYLRDADGNSVDSLDLASRTGLPSETPGIFIKGMKSLFEGAGHGRELINYAKSKHATLFLEPLDADAESFFKYLGFKESGLHIEEEKMRPILYL
ncbi:MAG: hypothetical protein GY861_27525 [bacterium]|nr:hypothetical protein [bacterium]